jgi:hypothetical protein
MFLCFIYKLDLQKYAKAKVEVSRDQLQEKEQERKLAQEQALVSLS